MRTFAAFLAFTFLLAQAIANDAPDSKPKPIVAASVPAASTPAASAPKAESPTAARDSTTEAAIAREAKLQQEVGEKITAQLLALRKQQAAKLANKKSAPVADSGHGTGKARNRHAKTASSEAHAVHWSYEGEGAPIRWGRLNPAWTKCESGTRQSPIDIRDGLKVELEQVNFDYKPVRFNVLDNGHTIQVNLGAGNHITVMGRMYELVQFHFHRPSEERVNGRGFQMVAHLVHKDVDGKLAVVAVLIEDGTPHELVQTVWNNLPLEKNEAVVPAGTMDMNQILPERRDYYTYMGSLTTPPCSEGVLWIVLKEPIRISRQQLAIFARLYPMNARPVQMSSGRMIKESN